VPLGPARSRAAGSPMTRTQVVILVAVLAGVVLLPCALVVLGAALYFVMPSPSRTPGPAPPPVAAPDERPVGPRPPGD
jgi:hypothetical protein